MKKLIFSLTLMSSSLWAQVSFTQQSVETSANYRMCVVDMNHDFLDDIVNVSNNSLEILYQQQNGNFSTVSYEMADVSSLPDWSLSAGDLNKDGFNDLLFGNSFGITMLVSNVNGDNINYETSNKYEYIFSQRSNFIDINNDGNLDVYVCHDTEPSVYYINNGNNEMDYFQGGLGDFPTGGHYGSIWTDYNNDGKIDLFIAKCGGIEERRMNQLYRNNGDGTFTDVAASANLNGIAENWSSAWGDFNNDGFMDVFNGINSQMQSNSGEHELMKNNGDETFTNVTVGSGFDTFNGKSREHFAYDFDNNGWIDIAGNSNKIFLNNGDFTFAPVDVPFSAASIGDLNNDGFLDAYAIYGSQEFIYVNNGNSNNWLKVVTKGVESNSNGIGARVELYSALGKQIRDVRSGEGFAQMSTLNTHFGIGQDTSIEKLIIRWPSGIVDQINNPEINSSIVVQEGSTLTVNDVDQFSKISIHPNPVKSIITLNGHSEIAPKYEINNLLGERLMSGNLKGGKLNVESLSSGIYILSVWERGKKTNLKFIKQ